MIDWYINSSRIIKDIRKKALDALDALYRKNGEGTDLINEYLSDDYKRLHSICKEEVSKTKLGRHIRFGKENDYWDILSIDLPDIESEIEKKLRHLINGDKVLGFEHLLHPLIKEHSYEKYKQGHIRNAVLDSITAVFDEIREKTGVNMDGTNLIDHVCSLSDPKMIFSELETDSGENDQKGFMQIFKGAFLGIRNPKSHSLIHDLDDNKAAQYLVFISLLARRVEEAKVIKGKKRSRQPVNSVKTKPKKEEVGSSLKVGLTYGKIGILPERHDYRLMCNIENINTTSINEFCVDIKFPSILVVDSLKFYYQESSDKKWKYYRITSENTDIKKMYPGDNILIPVLNYYIDNDIYSKHHGMFTENVCVTAYCNDKKAIVNVTMNDLHMF